MTQLAVTQVLGVVLSFLERILPLGEWWEKLGYWKALVFLGLNVVIAVGWQFLACNTGLPMIPATGLPCAGEGMASALVLGILAFATNQTTYSVATRRIG